MGEQTIKQPPPRPSPHPDNMKKKMNFLDPFTASPSPHSTRSSRHTATHDAIASSPGPGVPHDGAETTARETRGAFHDYYNDYSQIADPKLRRRLALSEIDKVGFGRYHIRTIAIIGLGILSDSYTTFALALTTPLIGVAFFSSDPSSLISTNTSATTTAAISTTTTTKTLSDILAKTSTLSQTLILFTLSGTILGHIIFGILSDHLGRRKAYTIQLTILISLTLCLVLSASSPVINITTILSFWTLLLGVAVGGGYTIAVITTLILTTIYSSLSAPTADRSWRILLSIPALFALLPLLCLYRCLPESPRWTFDVERDVEGAGGDIRAFLHGEGEGKTDPVRRARGIVVSGPALETPVVGWGDFWGWLFGERAKGCDPDDGGDRRRGEGRMGRFCGGGRRDVGSRARGAQSEKENSRIERGSWKAILGFGICWFLTDFVQTPLLLNLHLLLSSAPSSSSSTSTTTVSNSSLSLLQTPSTLPLTFFFLPLLAGSLPGTLLSPLTLDTIPRRKTQSLTFLLLTLLLALLAFLFPSTTIAENTTTANPTSRNPAILTLIVLVFFTLSIGPATTTSVVPAEYCTTRYRGTGTGICGAIGRLGGLVGIVVFWNLVCTSSTTTPSTARLAHEATIVRAGVTGGTDTGGSSSNNGGPFLPQGLPTFLKIASLLSFLGFLATIFLVPETKGWSLEELAGEKSTSYNAGRNGSIGGPGTSDITAESTITSTAPSTVEDTVCVARFKNPFTFHRGSIITVLNPFRIVPRSNGIRVGSTRSAGSGAAAPAGFFYPRVEGYLDVVRAGVSKKRAIGTARTDTTADTTGARDIIPQAQTSRSPLPTWIQTLLLTHPRPLPHNPNARASANGTGEIPTPRLPATPGIIPTNSHYFSRSVFPTHADSSSSDDSAAWAARGDGGSAALAGAGVGIRGVGSTAVVGAAVRGEIPVLPVWGAGWGRIDRGIDGIGMTEGIKLQDVGCLLRRDSDGT